MTMMSQWACAKCGTVSPPNRPRACACPTTIPPATPVSLPSEEELARALAEADGLVWGVLIANQETPNGCRADCFRRARAIRKLLIEKGVGNG